MSVYISHIKTRFTGELFWREGKKTILLHYEMKGKVVMGIQAGKEDGFKYDAFISYRHTSPDDRVAKVIQRKIEN